MDPELFLDFEIIKIIISMYETLFKLEHPQIHLKLKHILE